MQPLNTPLAAPAPMATPTPVPSPIPQPQAPFAGPALQDILNRLPQVTNILVTVKASPSVDELSAALGLTIALNNIGKHATAVFSGQIPDAMSFLKPDKTFESDVHSLRDFIISLNKEKADKLRFAQEGEIVKIFITPKSNLSSEDLSYNAGDFNVEMVLAFGIANQSELDSAIAAHGKILHDATVATLTAGPTPSSIGSINWFEPSLTSASAMVLQLLQAINPPVTISPDIATALLTGLVADTNMFSNQNTSPKTMELAAMLMSSGANHQLVASSIGVNPQTATSPAPAPATLEVTEQSVPTLSLTPEEAPASSAPNVIPMAQDTKPEVTQSQAKADLSDSKSVETLVKTEALAEAEPTISPALSEVLPKPVDITQPIVPAEILPPATPVSTSPTPETALPDGQQSAIITPQDPADEVGQIRSQIDQIYSQAPPEQNLNATTTAQEDLETATALPSSLLANQPAAFSSSPDLSVQSDQAAASSEATARTETSQIRTPIGSIQATRDEQVAADDILGIPKLNVPSELPPPPPPPPAGSTNSSFQPTIDFSQINQS